MAFLGVPDKSAPGGRWALSSATLTPGGGHRAPQAPGRRASLLGSQPTAWHPRVRSCGLELFRSRATLAKASVSLGFLTCEVGRK